jgi:outer membrane protein OmpA-like peptidoglycan-associated protein/tetratricopeptide (TPR) repeat protein/uncharacterized protein GlcG (DUF336 family)
MKRLLILILSISSFALSAQREQGYEMMEQFEYAKAISYASNFDESYFEDEDFTRLAYCYLMVQDFANAEKYYERVVKFDNVNPVNFKYYAICLKNSGKINEAKKYINHYAKTDSLSFLDKVFVASLNLLPTLKSSANNNLQAINVKSANNTLAQFSPKLINSKLFFIGEVKEDAKNNRLKIKLSDKFSANENLNYGMSERPLAQLFVADIDNTEINSLAVVARDSTYHIGSFDAVGNDFYFTLTPRINSWDVKNTSRSTLAKGSYDAASKKLTITSTSIFKNIKKEFSYGQPSFNKDGSIIVFAAHMPNGLGGADLYMSEKNGDSWSSPTNLGNEINTAGEESFPVFYNNTLYFSSNGHPGYGGMDIFKCELNGKQFSLSKILLEPYNSVSNDYGFVPFNDNEAFGYFTSNRFGGAGDDDIYLITDINTELLAKGKVVNEDGSAAQNVIAKLLDENGKEINISKTNEFGKFKFKLDDKAEYSVKAIKPGFVGTEKYSTKTGLNINKETQLVLKPAITAQGFVKNQDGSLVGSVLISVYDENGNLVYSTKTDENGYYALELEKDKTYNIVADKGDFMGNAIVKTNKDYDTFGNTDIILKPKSKVAGKIKNANGTNSANVSVKLFDENGNLLAATTTDENGNYNFTLVKDKNYQLLASKGDYEGDENIYTGQNWDSNKPLDITLKLKGKPTEGLVTNRITKQGVEAVKIVITDKSTNKKTILFTDKDGKFKSALRPNSNYIIVFSKDGFFPKTLEVPIGAKLPEKIDLNLDYDLSMDESGYMVKAIYFEFGKATITADSKQQLDLLADVMKKNPVSSLEVKAYADCRGSAQINMSLSIARAKSVKDYLALNGINSSRMGTKSMGATNFVNNCYKPEMCNEDEHALNRRAEFNINFDKPAGKKPL